MSDGQAAGGAPGALPIDALRERVLALAGRGPLVLAAPTGSGKSTQVPRWLCAEGARAVMIEPRRVACRSLAARIAELEGAALGGRVGYRVRGEQRRGRDTRLELCTPGIALRDLDALAAADFVILDEFHERRLDTDLLLGLLAAREGARRGLLVMSATIDGERIAAHLGGRYVEGEGRLFPVDVRYLDRGAERPRAEDLAPRVLAAVRRAAADPGDVLVFLPGRAEIAACEAALASEALDVRPLHGGLGLAEQSRAFAPGRRRKVVLSTNVAETSVTIPGVGVVIDSGLVRRTRYHHGRAFLTLAPVALDSAEQRAGRAGRTGPGVCYRLWSEAAILEARTPPEVHRETLVPMVLGAAHAGARLAELPLLDPPKAYALEDALAELSALGALDEQGALTGLGRELFAQPLDAAHARLLVEAQREPALLGDVIDLLGARSVGRPLFVGARPEREEDDLREAGCDVVATLRALREGAPRRHRLDAWALGEARREANRLRRAHGLEPVPDVLGSVDRRRLAMLVLRADPRTAHVARRRKRHVAFANGGTELTLGRESAVREEAAEAVLVLDSRAIDTARGKSAIIATCAMPVRREWLVDAGLGRERVRKVSLERGVVRATLERVFARRPLGEREAVPEGALAREAIATLVAQDRLLKGARAAIEARLRDWALAARLRANGETAHGVPLEVPEGDVPSLQEHLAAKLTELGVESGEDAALLSADDLLPPALAPWVRDHLDAEYPRTFELGDASYEVDYDLKRRQVVLRMIRGTRDTAPPAHYLPRFRGFRVCLESRRAMHVIRERG